MLIFFYKFILSIFTIFVINGCVNSSTKIRSFNEILYGIENLKSREYKQNISQENLEHMPQAFEKSSK